MSPHSDPEAHLGEPDSGGQCIYEQQLGKALTRQFDDIDVTIFCRDTKRRPRHTWLSDRCQVIRIECGATDYIPKEHIEAALPKFVHQVVRFLPFQESVVVHGHYWDGGKASLQLKRLLPKPMPLVWTPHSLGSLKRQNFKGLNHEVEYNFIPRITWENYTAFSAESVIVSSVQEKKVLTDEYLLKPTKVEIIPPGIDLEQLQPINQRDARQKYHLPEDGKVILCLGRMTPAKGYEHAIHGLASLLQKYTEPVYLVICGGSADNQTLEEKKYYDSLVEIVKDLRLQKQVIFLSAVPHDEINELYSAADIFVLPSEHEPFGLVALEAMACGVPLVAANTGGLASSLQHNLHACLVNIHNSERLSYYFLSLLKDTQFRHKLIRNGQNLVKESYGWDARATEFAQVYRQVLSKPSPFFHTWVNNNYFLNANV
ncbi:MAG TPA: glycosyltransferase [Vitreimonas sp.]|nr:glycosyltransferase [Vitreimonas sp.]